MYKDNVVKTLTGGVAGLLKSNGVTLVNGEAALEDATTVACAGKTYKADKIILCGGSKAIRIPIPGVDGSFGIGIANVKKSVERAVGADILFGGDNT